MTPKLPPQGKEIQPDPVIIYIILIIMAAVTLLGLDYLNWEKGNKSYIFAFFLGGDTAKPAASSRLFDTARTIIQKKERSADDLSYYRDEEGFFHIMLKLTGEEYNQLSQTLKTAFQASPADVTTESRPHEEGNRYILWRVENPEGETLYILFLIQYPPMEKTGPSQVHAGRVALIIDDLGYSLNSIRTICDLKQKLTVAVLPHSPLAMETARTAQRNNLEVILHLPLESLNNHYDNDHTEGLIHSGMRQAEIIASVDEGMQKVPYIRGVNTHMGSKITQNPEFMKTILHHVKSKRLYFIDSRTTPKSVAFAVARELGVPSARRNIFLDNEVSPEYIRNQFIKLLKTALRNGYAVGICHPYPETLEALKNNFHLVKEYSLEAVYASEIVQ